MLVEGNSLYLCKYLSCAACCCLLLFLLCLWLSPCRCSAQGRASSLAFLFSLPSSASASCKISTSVLSPALTARAGFLAGISSAFHCCCRQSLHPILVAQKAQQGTELSMSHSRSKALGAQHTGSDGLITQVCAEGWDTLITERDMEERAKQWMNKSVKRTFLCLSWELSPSGVSAASQRVSWNSEPQRHKEVSLLVIMPGH